MKSVHVFISSGRFCTIDEMRAYIDETYTDDGDGLPSEFIDEVALDEYEPHCIEAIVSSTGAPLPLSELLIGASFHEQWLPQVDGSRTADAAICVYPPNIVDDPEGCSLEYVGAFNYRGVPSR
jgi:hypothetical protein